MKKLKAGLSGLEGFTEVVGEPLSWRFWIPLITYWLKVHNLAKVGSFLYKVCPSGSIQIKEGKAEHLPERCQTCLACVHLCPQKAMGLNVSEKNPDARYINDHVAVEEIIEANNQI